MPQTIPPVTVEIECLISIADAAQALDYDDTMNYLDWTIFRMMYPAE